MFESVLRSEFLEKMMTSPTLDPVSRKYILDRTTTYTLFRQGSETQDFLQFRLASGPTVEITEIVVGTERCAGHGSSMIRTLIDHLPPEINTLWAVTRYSNVVAQNFYTKLGFRILGRLNRFYQDEQLEEPPPRDSRLVDAIVFGYDLPH